MFKGSFTALATPFKDDRVDEVSFERLIEFQIENGITGIVPAGSTGESATLDHQEHRQVIELAVQSAKGRCKVIAGTGSNSTAEAVALTRDAESAGADAFLVVAPYYNKPSQEGVFQHFQKIAAATEKPVVLYSIPGRCVIEIAVETVARLAAHCPNIVALKESGGNLERVNQLREALPESFALLSGDDSLTLPFMAVGAVGVISVASNLIPREVATLVRLLLEGDLLGGRRVHSRLYPLFRDLFAAPNPVPLKAALEWTGIIETPDVRLPLTSMPDSAARTLRTTLERMGLIP